MWANMTLDTKTLTNIWLQKLKWKLNAKYTVRMLILTWTRFCRVWQPQHFVLLLLLLLLAVTRIPYDRATTPVSLCSHSFVMTQGAPSPVLPLSRCHYHSALFMSHSVTRLLCLCLQDYRKPGCVGLWMQFQGEWGWVILFLAGAQMAEYR